MINGSFLAHAYGSPITLGIIVAYLIGKPIGISGSTWLVTRLSGGRIRPPVGWGSVIGGGAIAGIGFTVSILIATLAFHGQRARRGQARRPDDARRGAADELDRAARDQEAAARRVRLRALVGSSEVIVDLAVPVDPERDHIRGPDDASVTLVEYGDLECPYCGQAEAVIRELLLDFGGSFATSGATCPSTTFTRTRSSPPRRPRRRRPRAILGDARLAVCAPGPAHGADLVADAEALGLDVDGFREHIRKSKAAATDRRGRRVGRPERRLGDADVLHQRPPPPGRVRHRDAVEAVRLARARAVVGA